MPYRAGARRMRATVLSVTSVRAGLIPTANEGPRGSRAGDAVAKLHRLYAGAGDRDKSWTSRYSPEGTGYSLEQGPGRFFGAGKGQQGKHLVGHDSSGSSAGAGDGRWASPADAETTPGKPSPPAPTLLTDAERNEEGF